MEKFSYEANGYNRGEVNNFVKEVIKETEDIINKVKANPSLSGGEKTDGYCPMNQCLPRILERI